MRIGDWIQQATQQFISVGILDPFLDAQLLAAHSLGKSRSWILANLDSDVGSNATKLLNRRLNREPLSYILGTREFYGRSFRVFPGVLIPRQESETLIDVALAGLGGKVLDVGTGSGCLAITLKLERSNWMVAACDINPVAIHTARQNAEALGATIHCLRSDLFEAFQGIQFGLIVSNPPYIALNTVLQPEIAMFEPHEALFADKKGLAMYERLAVESKPHLMPWGRIIVELGDGMASDVVKIFNANGFQLLELTNDLAGTPRAASFQKSKA